MLNTNEDRKQLNNSARDQEQLSLVHVLTEINKKLSAGENYQKVLDFVFDSLDLVIPYDRIGIALVEGVGDEAQLSLKWVRSRVPINHMSSSYSAPLKGSSLLKIIESGQPRIINDLSEYLKTHPLSASTKLVILDGIRSSLTCPLRSENKQIGIVFFSSRQSGIYLDEHIQSFLEIADQLSMVVEHGRLKEESNAFATQSQNLRMILHDLKSPLSTIKGFAELSIDEPWFQTLDPDGKEVFQVFLRNSKYMFELLNELNEISSLEQKSALAEVKDVELNGFYEEMEAFGKSLGQTKEIEFVSDISPRLPSLVRFDPRQIKRVLDNLFSNSVKYSKRGGKTVFTISVEPGRLVFSVRDYGLGIPSAELGKLFREFGKTSVRPTEGETSTGLGLAIAKKIIAQSHGEISVVSEVGQGSTFSFWIPLNAD